MNTLEALKAKLDGKDVQGYWPNDTNPYWAEVDVNDICVAQIEEHIVEWRLKPEIVTVDMQVWFHQGAMFRVPGEMSTEPNTRISYADAQSLMDQLWDCGMRPSEGTGSAGSLAATEKHLKDMQKIAFTLLDKSVTPITPDSGE